MSKPHVKGANDVGPDYQPRYIQWQCVWMTRNHCSGAISGYSCLLAHTKMLGYDTASQLPIDKCQLANYMKDLTFFALRLPDYLH